MGDFADTVRRFAKVAKENTDKAVREIEINLFNSVITLSPVGRPELWARNRVANEYNVQVAAHNDALRDNPDNLDKRGRLKRGRKLNDGMDISAPAGYVGGRFRGAWTTTVGEPGTSPTDRVDPTGAAAMAEVLANVGGAGKVTFLTNTLPYGIPLEYESHSKQAPAGMVRVSVAKFGEFVEAAGK
jgi:hypothetical protein